MAYKNALIGTGPEIETLRLLANHLQARGINARLLIKGALQVEEAHLPQAQAAADEFARVTNAKLEQLDLTREDQTCT